MKRLAFSALLLASAAALTSEARADVVWKLNNVVFDDGGKVANGTFTVNVYGYLTDSAIFVTTTAGSALSGDTYDADLVAENINNVGGSGLPDDTVTFFSSTLGYQGVLNLEFQYVLTSPLAHNPIVGGSGGPSWECAVGWGCPPYAGTPIRYVSEGYASAATAAVPEAPTWALMMAGAGLLACGHTLLRRRPNPRIAGTVVA